MFLLSQKPLSEISIREIAEVAQVNRNTFYYHFKNVPDLLESVVRGLVDEILAKHPPTYESLEECFLAALSLARDNKELIYHIYHSTNRAIFERHLWHVIDYSISSFMESFPNDGRPMTRDEENMVRDFLKYECFGFAIDWINKGMPEGVVVKLNDLINFMLARLKNV